MQKLKKLKDKKCCFCGEDNYNVLDVHRIVEGSNGGKYKDWNTITCCAVCHRRIHANEIHSIKKYQSTGGIVINYVENNEEKWKEI